jgi:hypothetical protein
MGIPRQAGQRLNSVAPPLRKFKASLSLTTTTSCSRQAVLQCLAERFNGCGEYGDRRNAPQFLSQFWNTRMPFLD